MKSGTAELRRKARIAGIGLTCGVLALAMAGCSKQGVPANTDWAILGGGYKQQQNADLPQIDKDNVKDLGLAWSAEIPSASGLVGNPLVEDGVVYQSGSLARIFANDVHTGKLLWKYEPEFDFTKMGPEQIWGARINRGVALAGNLVVVGTGDCRVIAVDRKTGKEAWEVKSCDNPHMGITGAPQVGDGKVFVGNFCGDTGNGRGFIDAFDEKTGKRSWRFYTVPGDPSKPPENAAMAMAAKTWGTGWYKITKGCGSAWDSMTYDKETNLVYVGIGGPSPWPLSSRAKDAGDELFTNAIVAIDASTGKYVWHYTVTPHDGWNFEAVGPIMIADLPIGGKPRRVVMSAPKNGFFYVLDAKTGKFISAKAAVPQNWAKGIDPKTGRPIFAPGARYWEKSGQTGVVWPGPLGAHSWSGIAYDPRQHLVYVPYDNIPTQVTVNHLYDTGAVDETFVTPGGKDKIPERYSELVAWDPVKQEARWRVRSKSLVDGGVLHTSGGLVFQGTSDGHFNAYDDATGKLLWSYYVEGGIRSAPSSVMVDGQQYILIASGNGNSMVSSRYVSREATNPVTRAAPSLLLAFKIGGKATLPKVKPALLQKPDYPKPSASLAEEGKPLFEAYACLVCHGRDAISAGGEIPDLRQLDAAMFDQVDTIVRGGALKALGMPHYDTMPPEHLAAIKAYIQSRAWADYEAQQKAQK